MNELLNKVIEQCGHPVELVGFLGQLVFFARFFVQWVASEKKKESVIPEAFWWISIVGGGITLVYALARDPPLPAIILAQACGNVIYIRNLVLIRRMKRRLAPDTGAAQG